MVTEKRQNSFFDPRRGDEAVRMRSLRLARDAYEPERTNCFCIYWIESGAGECFVDAAQHPFDSQSLLFFSPYQYVRLMPRRSFAGTLIEFHANFLCVETFHAEVGCSSALFNDPYGVPVVSLDDQANAEVKDLIGRIGREQDAKQVAHSEVVLAYLKVLLVHSVRSKTQSSSACPRGADPRHPVLSQLKELIEEHYASLHAPADYARLLHTTPKTLGRIVREQLGMTLTDLIRNRILIHAKWQLLHTLKPVKEVAAEVGFSDELYFSRLFRKATGVSPTFFREFETEIRGGSNLSMTLSQASIPLHPANADDRRSDRGVTKHR